MTKIEKHNSSTLQDLYLSAFQRNNPQCSFTIDEGKLIIERLWNDEDVRFVFDPSEVELLKDINHVAFRPQFDAIFHVDTNELELFYGYLLPEEEPDKSFMNRNFELYFAGQKYNCSYREPSNRLFQFAKRMRRLPVFGQNVASQLIAFKDAQQLEKLPEKAKAYYTERVPRSFFISTTSSAILDIDLTQLARHINFHMSYYDRKSPVINIRREEMAEKSKQVVPMRFLAGTFPDAMSIHEIDDFILQLIEVAKESSPRFAFIYYYQVFEYAGFYFVDQKAKKEIRQFLRDPAMIMCPEEKVGELLTVLSDLQHSDEVKMQKVIEEFCDPDGLWGDVENDKDFFSKDVLFDGGFNLSALISGDGSKENWRATWMPKLFTHLTKVRNCLVHAREKRQSQVILPTKTNSDKIKRYLPLIRRLAEQIALSKV